MEGTEKKTPFKALVEKGKATGKLTTQDIDAAMIEMNLDVEELDKLSQNLAILNKRNEKRGENPRFSSM